MPLILPLKKEEEFVNGIDIKRSSRDQLAQEILD
jgi:hypothetical protein